MIGVIAIHVHMRLPWNWDWLVEWCLPTERIT